MGPALLEFRVYLPGRVPFTERAIGLSVIVAHYPDALRVERVMPELPPCAGCQQGSWW